MEQWKQIPCQFNIGDIVEIKKGYLQKMMLGPILTYNDGDRYQVTGFINNRYENKQGFIVKCLQSVRCDRIGSISLIDCHMPVYDFFKKVMI